MGFYITGTSSPMPLGYTGLRPCPYQPPSPPHSIPAPRRVSISNYITGTSSPVPLRYTGLRPCPYQPPSPPHSIPASRRVSKTKAPPVITPPRTPRLNNGLDYFPVLSGRAMQRMVNELERNFQYQTALRGEEPKPATPQDLPPKSGVYGLRPLPLGRMGRGGPVSPATVVCFNQPRIRGVNSRRVQATPVQTPRKVQRHVEEYSRIIHTRASTTLREVRKRENEIHRTWQKEIDERRLRLAKLAQWSSELDRLGGVEKELARRFELEIDLADEVKGGTPLTDDEHVELEALRKMFDELGMPGEGGGKTFTKAEIKGEQEELVKRIELEHRLSDVVEGDEPLTVEEFEKLKELRRIFAAEGNTAECRPTLESQRESGECSTGTV